MSLCFLTGSDTGKNLKVLHNIEYLTYHIPRPSEYFSPYVEVIGDFIVCNCGDEPAALIMLHRGNIDLEAPASPWRENKYWTQNVLKKYAADTLRLKFADHEKVRFFYDQQYRPLKVYDGKFHKWGPDLPAKPEEYALFSGKKTDDIQPGEYAIIRTQGLIQGDSFPKLKPEGYSDDYTQICGGDPLIDTIYKDIEKHRRLDTKKYKCDLYEKEFDTFLTENISHADYYQLFLEKSDGSKITKDKKEKKDSNESTKDILSMLENEEVGERLISWFSSEYHYTLFAKIEGPVLELALS